VVLLMLSLLIPILRTLRCEYRRLVSITCCSSPLCAGWLAAVGGGGYGRRGHTRPHPVPHIHRTGRVGRGGHCASVQCAAFGGGYGDTTGPLPRPAAHTTRRRPPTVRSFSEESETMSRMIVYQRKSNRLLIHTTNIFKPCLYSCECRSSGTQGDVAVPPAWAVIVASGSKLHVATLPHNLDPGTAQHTQVRKLCPFLVNYEPVG
jgi:hypothetical protein